MYFDRAWNALKHRIREILISLEVNYYPFIAKLNFDCTNNKAKYEAYIMRLQVAIKRGIRTLQVFEDSAFFIYQLKGEWQTCDAKLIHYENMILKLKKKFDDISFQHLP